MSGERPTATVVIVSKNRCDDLRKAIASALAQDVPVEVLVIDDGSTDGTAEMVQKEFAAAKLIRHGESRGLVVRRNQGAAAATCDIVVSIDDDATFASKGIVRETVAAFDTREVGAVAIPYSNVNRSTEVFQRAPGGDKVYVTETFIGTAHALRREIFTRLGGYREQIFHQGEEADYCIRMLAAGYVVRLGYGDPIHHFESPRRDFRRMDHYGPRNAVLFTWQNVPFPLAPIQMASTIAGVLALTLRPRRFLTRLGGVVDGLVCCARFERAPVSEGVFRLWRRLRQARTGLSLADIASDRPSRA